MIKKRFHLYLLFTFFISIATLFFSCEKNSEQEEPQNLICEIKNPQEGSTYSKGEIIEISVETVDNENLLREIRFYINNVGVSSVTSFPFTYNWHTDKKEFGIYHIKVKAIFENEKIAEDSVSIKLTNTGNTLTDYEGNTYKTVIIGNQEWMCENLKVTSLNDGTPITLETKNENWSKLNTAAYCWYDNNTKNADTYGALYNWHAVITEKLCPIGWHIPTDSEWKELEIFLGMTTLEADNHGQRGTNEGSILASNSELWIEGNLINDKEFGISGFNAFPGGKRGATAFNYLEEGGFFWSSTLEIDTQGELAWFRMLFYNTVKIDRQRSVKESGFSVRCIKD